MELKTESRCESALISSSGYEAVNLKKLHPSLKKDHVQMELRRESRYEFVLVSPSGCEVINLKKLHPSIKKPMFRWN